jgi:DNA-directed RNA polymerase subunit omega
VVFRLFCAIVPQVFLLRFSGRTIKSQSRVRNLILASGLTHPDPIMKPELVKAAAAVIHNQQILVNMVSRRVRQLTLGHRPLVEFVPGLGHADIALSEIATGKLVFESTLGESESAGPTEVVRFPGIIVSKKAKKAA